MISVSYFTPLTFPDDYKRSVCDSFLEGVDDYFHLGGDKYCLQKRITDQANEKFVNSNRSLFTKILLIFSYVILPLSLLMLGLKLILRTIYDNTLRDDMRGCSGMIDQAACDKFNHERGIHNNTDPIKVDIENLGLDLSRTQEIEVDGTVKSVTMREITQALVADINAALLKYDDRTRFVALEFFHQRNHNIYKYRYLASQNAGQNHSHWFKEILEALEKTKSIFKLVGCNQQEFMIKA